MDIIGNLGDPAKDVAALTPLALELETKIMADIQNILVPTLEKSLVSNVLPALEESLKRVLDGMTITISISRKP